MEKQKEISPKVLKVFDDFCAKSKKICALCEESLKVKEIKASGRYSAGARLSTLWLGFKHPTKKSKSYRLCGACYADIKSR